MRNPERFWTRRLGAILIAWGVCLSSGQAPAQIVIPSAPGAPGVVNYQGVLTDSEGQPLADGEVQLTARIFAAATGGEAHWGPMIYDNGTGDGHGPRVRLVDGRFNIVLGPKDTAGRAVTNAFVLGGERFLEIAINDGDPIVPRLSLNSAPYAFRALAATEAGSLRGQRIEMWIDRSLAPFTDPAMVITNSGNVGINTTAPDRRLHVEGSARVDGPASINGFMPILNFSGGTTDFTHRYVHIRTPDWIRPLFIITEDNGEGDGADAPLADDADMAPQNVIYPVGRIYRHFMIEGMVPNGYRFPIISKRISYNIIQTSVTAFHGQAGADLTDMTAPFLPVPVAYVGSDHHVYIRFYIPAGIADDGEIYTSQDTSFVLFGMRTYSGLPPLTGYTVTVSNHLTL